MIGRRVAPDRPAVRLTGPVRKFLETEAAGALPLLGAVVVALAWANSPWQEGYESVWATELRFGLGGMELAKDLRHWVNDGLMVVFFLVVGLEIKRELAEGELSLARKAMVPAVGALGGMLVPALLFLAINPSGEERQGWGIPVATDIALALGVLALLARRAPAQLRILLLSLAIADDVGAILIIAVFYSSDIQWVALGVAAALVLAVVLLQRLAVWWAPAYVLVGLGVWFATLLSGIHPTIAGVVLGLMAPVRPLNPEQIRVTEIFDRGDDDEEELPVEQVREAQLRLLTSTPVTDRLEHVLHPWTSFLILPLFALANAGVPLTGAQVLEAMRSPVSLGIVAGLVLGKPLGIVSFIWVAVRLGAERPAELGWRHVLGVGALAGIGFTMSLFIGELAFGGSDLVELAKVGILVASAVAAGVGALLLVTFRSEADSSA